MKKTMVSAAVLASAALALPVLAQTDANDTNGTSSYDAMDDAGDTDTTTGTDTDTTSVGADTDTDAEGNLDVTTDAASSVSSSSVSSAADVGADTDTDTDDTTVPGELPDTGGGWGATR